MKGIYMMGGYPDMETFCDEFVYSQDCSLDFVEIGLPFNDPVADGPVISEAGEKVIAAGVKTEDILHCVRQHKKTKIYAMTYSNIIYNYPLRAFNEHFKDVLNGVIIADLPNKYHYFFKEKGFEIPIIPFATLDSNVEELKNVICGQDFVYFVGLKGVTGSKANFGDMSAVEKITEIKQQTGSKVVFGFGIKTARDAEKVLKFADGFVVGTEVVKRQPNPAEFKKYVAELGSVSVK